MGAPVGQVQQPQGLGQGQQSSRANQYAPAAMMNGVPIKYGNTYGQEQQPQQSGMTQQNQPFNLQQSVAQGMQQAGQASAQGLNYQPQQVNPTGFQAAQTQQLSPLQAQQVQAGQLSNTNLSPYTNPFESQVVNQSLQDLERSRLMQQNQMGASATQARAFGGSRHGIAEAETNRNYADQAARTASQLRAGGFENAQNMAQYDIASRMQAGTQNQNAGLQAGIMSAQLQQNANLANQEAQQQASRFGAESGMQAQQYNQQAGLQGNAQRMQAAGQLGQQATTGYDISRDISNQMQQQGEQNQVINQALIDAGRNQYGGFMGAPSQGAAMMVDAQPNIRTGDNTVTNTTTPGLLEYGQMAASVYKPGGITNAIGGIKGMLSNAAQQRVSNYGVDMNGGTRQISNLGLPSYNPNFNQYQQPNPYQVYG
jgi:hypothetical protein